MRPFRIFRKSTFALLLAVTVVTQAIAQQPAAVPIPLPRVQFFSAAGAPLAGGFVYTYAAGTTTPQATYTDSTGTVLNSNPIILDSGGFANIWIGPLSYKILVKNSAGSTQWMVDNVSDAGQLLYANAVIKNPTGGALQTIVGPLQANYFQQSLLHTTSPGVRVSILDPSTTLDTPSNPPTLVTTTPGGAGRVYTIPDPGGSASFVMNPAGGTANVIDCSLAGLTCKRTAYIYIPGASCNNSTAASGFDNFPSSAPLPVCFVGTNQTKGVLTFPSAATLLHQAQVNAAASSTCVITYPGSGTNTGSGLVLASGNDGSKTVTGVTDGTNVYTRIIAQTNGALNLELWYFNGNSTAMPGGTSLTVTYSGATNCAVNWAEYQDTLTAGLLDKSASTSGSSVTPATGATATTANATELIFSGFVASGGPTATGQNGSTFHTTAASGANVLVGVQGDIQQAVAAQSRTFTLSAGNPWAGAIATFKVNAGTSAKALKSFALQGTYNSAQNFNAKMMWQVPVAPTGTVTAAFSSQLACTVPGFSDDPAFNTGVSATLTLPTSAGNVLQQTTFSNMSQAGCAPSNLLHYGVFRDRYAVTDTYEGAVYMIGVGLDYGITQ